MKDDVFMDTVHLILGLLWYWPPLYFLKVKFTTRLWPWLQGWGFEVTYLSYKTMAPRNKALMHSDNGIHKIKTWKHNFTLSLLKDGM